MKNIIPIMIMLFCISFLYANGQQEDGGSTNEFSNYLNWEKVNNEVITGDVIGILGPAHQRAQGFREIYVNDIGKEVSSGEKSYPYPSGSIILKESFKADNGKKGDLADITIMVKREDGYDPENGNWEYFMANSQLKVSKQGKIGMCIGCHSAVSSTDYTFWDSSL